MKPKTILESKIVAISNSLPKFTLKQHESGFHKCFEKYAIQSRKTMFCLECGHRWKLENIQNVNPVACEHCRQELKIVEDYKNGIRETDYYQVITAVGQFQIVRMVCITKSMKKNSKSTFFAHEVMQIFFDETGTPKCMAKNVMGMSRYYDQWIVGSEISLKHYDNNRFHLRPGCILRSKKVLPILKRNGFKGNFHGIAPQVLFKELLSDNISETLLKSNQIDLLHYHIRNTRLKRDGIYWDALKICNRNNYQINDAKLWIDYIDLLHHFGKDLQNAVYVCPSNLELSHDKLMHKKLQETVESTLEEKKKQIAKNQRHYFKTKNHFFGLIFSEKNITINVIETVKEFLEEGCIHRHCVFTNEYYKKANSLILSAKVNGRHAETIQVSLDNLEVLQSRGRGNKASKHNKAIISLVNKNLHRIGERMKKAS